MPFASSIMSTSNHKPFTLPSGIAGVQARQGGRKAGVRYADYALGKFFDAAKMHDWYRNALFVIVADHGARVYGAADVPLHSYEIPILILAPAHLPPGRSDTLIDRKNTHLNSSHQCATHTPASAWKNNKRKKEHK